MALIIETFIDCDKCGCRYWADSNLKGMQLRALARGSGWVYHGKDVCPACRVKGKDGKEFKHSKNRTRRNNNK